tara:strand:+ start:693 stop:1676 length:984 start_codon:yes stop_codon:yes gene_type:complete
MIKKISYGSAICSAFDYLLTKYPEVFLIGQGLWSPWYVGNSMIDLDKKYGQDRVIDSPVSESAVTGAAVGSSLTGMRPVVIHPRMDFMLYAMDAIVNQAAKWSHMTGGQANPCLTIRSIINRGGEQGAQHSQSLHSWFAHIPGLKVIIPFSPLDARDLLISSVLSNDPVIYIDDRWLYEEVEEIKPIKEIDLNEVRPKYINKGNDLTIVGSSYSTLIAKNVSEKLKDLGVYSDVIDLRIINPFNPSLIIDSVKKTGKLVVIDGGWSTCGLASEVIASVYENLEVNYFKIKPLRITLPNSPAPTSKKLENIYYHNTDAVLKKILTAIN